jgi:hypothetical protein
MEELKKKLHQEAVERYGNITPCSRYKIFEQCFKKYENKLTFWFNVEDGSTKVICHDLDQEI